MFATFLRYGEGALSDIECKSLLASDDAKGGFLAPPEFVTALDSTVLAYSPFRALASARSISTGSAILPKRVGSITSAVSAEGADVGDGQPATMFGQVTVEIEDQTAFIDISNALLNDVAFDIQADIVQAFSEDFGEQESRRFVVDLLAGIPADRVVAMSGTATAVNPTIAETFKLTLDLSQAYARNAVWTMGSDSAEKIASISRAIGGDAWTARPEGYSLHGRPVVIAPGMPSYIAGNTPIVFGDLRAAFRIIDRKALSIVRDPYSLAAKGQTRFIGRKRSAGVVTNPSALLAITPAQV